MNTAIGTPAPMPALAPVDKLDDNVDEEDENDEELGVGFGCCVEEILPKGVEEQHGTAAKTSLIASGVLPLSIHSGSGYRPCPTYPHRLRRSRVQHSNQELAIFKKEELNDHRPLSSKCLVHPS